MDDVLENFNGHSLFAPSSAAMWIGCPASLRLNMIERQKGESGNMAAAQGTVAHHVAEVWLNDGKKPKHLLGTVHEVSGFEIEIDLEMLDYVEPYVTWCQNQDGDKYVEVQTDFSHLTPIQNQMGTSDHVCCKNGLLTITDLKYGIGVKVFAENNKQLQIYALGIFEKYDWLYDFKEICIRICQPRLNHFDVWTVSREDLLMFGETVKVAALAAWDKNAPRKPSKSACQWCKVRAECPALAAEMVSIVKGENVSDDDIFAELESEEFLETVQGVENLSIEQLEKIYNKSKLVTGFLDDVERKIFDFLLKGGKLQTLKVVLGRTSRHWQSDSEAIAYLSSVGISEDEFNPRSLVSVAGAEKLLRKKGVDKNTITPYIMSRDGKPTIAPMSDKRPEWKGNSDDGIY